VKNIRKSGFEKVDGYCKPYLPVPIATLALPVELHKRSGILWGYD